MTAVVSLQSSHHLEMGCQCHQYHHPHRHNSDPRNVFANEGGGLIFGRLCNTTSNGQCRYAASTIPGNETSEMVCSKVVLHMWANEFLFI